jgi:4-carboxymuconolactone decarboxylase
MENVMSELNSRESELVALGAALGSNCVPCIEYHIPQARKAGLTDLEIHAAIRQADKVRQVPARKVLETAMKLLAPAAEAASAEATGCGCGSAGTAAAATQSSDAGRATDGMAGMMSKMMSSCAPLAAAAAGTQMASGKDRVAGASEAGSGCC